MRCLPQTMFCVVLISPRHQKPVGIPTVSIAHCLSRLPCSSVTCFIDCLPFHLRMVSHTAKYNTQHVRRVCTLWQTGLCWFLTQEQIQTWKPLFQAFASYRNRCYCILDKSTVNLTLVEQIVLHLLSFQAICHFHRPVHVWTCYLCTKPDLYCILYQQMLPVWTQLWLLSWYPYMCCLLTCEPQWFWGS